MEFCKHGTTAFHGLQILQTGCEPENLQKEHTERVTVFPVVDKMLALVGNSGTGMWEIFLSPLVTYLLYLYNPSLNRLPGELWDLSQFSYYFNSIQFLFIEQNVKENSKLAKEQVN